MGVSVYGVVLVSFDGITFAIAVIRWLQLEGGCQQPGMALSVPSLYDVSFIHRCQLRWQRGQFRWHHFCQLRCQYCFRPQRHHAISPDGIGPDM